MVSREYLVAGHISIGDVDVLPIVELWVKVGEIYTVQSCLAIVRPLGFALLIPEGGYWLAYPHDLDVLADAIHSVNKGFHWASWKKEAI